MSAVPVLQDELNRKSAETLHWLLHSLLAGRITEAQCSTGLDALFACVSGLTDKNFIELLTEAALHCKTVEQQRRVFISGDRTTAVTWQAGSDTVRVSTFQAGVQVRTVDKECGTAQDAKAYFEKCGKLVEVGYTEL